MGIDRNGDSDTLEFIRNLLRLTRDHDIEDDLRWLVDDDGTIQFYVLCNDTFLWGCADVEDVTPDNLYILEQTCKDCKELDKAENMSGGCGFAMCYAAELFAARVRKTRPQGASYMECYPKRMWLLFDACGPEREIDFVNPRRVPDYIDGRTDSK